MWKPSELELVIGLLAIALIGFVAYDWWTQPLVSERKQEQAQEHYDQYKELTNDPDYLPGYASDKVINKLQQALERDPTRNDIRMELFSIHKQKTGHFEGQQEKMKTLLEDGLKVDMAPEKRQELATAAASYYPGLLDAKSPAEARLKAVEIAPYTDWAIKWRVRFAAIKAKNGNDNALSALRKVEDAIQENAQRDGTLNESQLRYVQYLRGRYYKKIGEYEKAVEYYSALMDELFSRPTSEEKAAGVQAGNLSYGDLMKETLNVFEEAGEWRELKKLIELSYKVRTDDSRVPDRSKWGTRDRNLWRKADENIEKDGKNG